MSLLPQTSLQLGSPRLSLLGADYRHTAPRQPHFAFQGHQKNVFINFWLRIRTALRAVWYGSGLGVRTSLMWVWFQGIVQQVLARLEGRTRQQHSSKSGVSGLEIVIYPPRWIYKNLCKYIYIWKLLFSYICILYIYISKWLEIQLV